MQFHTKPSRSHQTFLKKGREVVWGLAERGGLEGSLVELRKEDENCRQMFKIQVVCTEKLKHYIVLQRNLNTFYCKYLHGE